jgi:hypothetical protein
MTQNGINAVFQTGVIFGRITQLSVDRGFVMSQKEMALSDFLTLLSEEMGDLPVNPSVCERILAEVKELIESLKKYEADEPLKIDDSRIMIGFVSRWTDILLDEFINHSGNIQNDTENAKKIAESEE